MPLPGDVSSSSSSPSSRVTQPPARVVGLSKNGDNRRLQQPSPARNDSKEGSALEWLTLALERGGINSRMDDLQIKMLADYQPFDPRETISSRGPQVSKDWYLMTHQTSKS